MSSADRFPNPNHQYCDASGNPYAGGKLYAYATGTVTPRNTFSNAGLTVANANPIILDSAGRVGNCFLTPGVDYKFVLTDANDVQVWSADPVAVSGSFVQQLDTYTAIATSNIPTDIDFIQVMGRTAVGDGGGPALYKRISTPSPVKAWHVASADGAYWQYVPDGGCINVKHFGAKGDGSTDDTTAINNACLFFDQGYSDDLSTSSHTEQFGYVWLPEGQYMVDPTVSIQPWDNIRIYGAGRGVTQIIASNTSAGKLLGRRDWSAPAPARGYNNRIQRIHVDGIRFVPKGTFQTCVDLSHIGYSLVSDCQMTRQTRAREYNNNDQTPLNETIGVQLAVWETDAAAAGYAGGEGNTIRDCIIEYMYRGIRLGGITDHEGGHAHAIIDCHINSNTCNIEGASSYSDDVRIFGGTNQRWGSGNYGIDWCGRKALIEGIYFENTDSGTLGAILFRDNGIRKATGNHVGQNHLSVLPANTYPITDNGTGNRFTQLTSATTEATSVGGSDTQFVTLSRGSNNLTLTASATTLITGETVVRNWVNNSPDTGTNYNSATDVKNGVTCAFDGMATISISFPLLSDTAHTATLLWRKNSTVIRQKSIPVINGTYNLAESQTFHVARGDQLDVRITMGAGVHQLTAAATAFIDYQILSGS